MYCSTTPLISRSIFSTLREIPFNYILSTFFSPDFNEVVESVHHHIDQRKNKHGKCLQNSIVKSTLGRNVYMQEFQTINRIFDLIKLVSLVFFLPTFPLNCISIYLQNCVNCYCFNDHIALCLVGCKITNYFNIFQKLCAGAFDFISQIKKIGPNSFPQQIFNLIFYIMLIS